MITRWELFNVTQTFDFNFHQFEILLAVLIQVVIIQ